MTEKYEKPPKQETLVGAFNVSEFCRQYSISRPYFYKIKQMGQGPRMMRVGGKVLISFEAAREWERQRELEAA